MDKACTDHPFRESVLFAVCMHYKYVLPFRPITTNVYGVFCSFAHRGVFHSGQMKKYFGGVRSPNAIKRRSWGASGQRPISWKGGFSYFPLCANNAIRTFHAAECASSRLWSGRQSIARGRSPPAIERSLRLSVKLGNAYRTWCLR